jgi:hypothetical protein
MVTYTLTGKQASGLTHNVVEQLRADVFSEYELRPAAKRGRLFAVSNLVQHHTSKQARLCVMFA